MILFVTWKGVKEMSRIEKQSYDHKALFVSTCVFKLFFSCKSGVQELPFPYLRIIAVDGSLWCYV